MRTVHATDPVMDPKNAVNEKPAVRLKAQQLFDRLRHDGGHVYVGEYRGSVAEEKQFVEDDDYGDKKKGDVTRYISLKHAVEIRTKGLPKTETFNQRIDGTVTPERCQRIIDGLGIKRGETVAVWNPRSFTQKKTGTTTMTAPEGLVVLEG